MKEITDIHFRKLRINYSFKFIIAALQTKVDFLTLQI